MSKILKIIFSVLALSICSSSLVFAADGDRLREADLSAYTTTYDESTDGTLVVKNSHTPETNDYTVGIHWDDDKDRDGVRPDSVTLQLYNGDTAVDEKTVDLSSANQVNSLLETWQSRINADKYQNHGEEINYTVKLISGTPDQYRLEYSAAEPLFVTAIHTIDTIPQLEYEVTFDDDNDRDGIRPDEIKVQLYQNDEPYGDPVVIDCSSGTCTFNAEDLPENVDGEPAEYSIKPAEDINDYEPEYDPTTGNITLKHDAYTKNINVTKVWDDNFDQDGLRPDSICVILRGDTEDYSHTLTGSKDVEEWAYTFENIHVNRDGDPIAYSIVEDGLVCGSITTQP